MIILSYDAFFSFYEGSDRCTWIRTVFTCNICIQNVVQVASLTGRDVIFLASRSPLPKGSLMVIFCILAH